MTAPAFPLEDGVGWGGNYWGMRGRKSRLVARGGLPPASARPEPPPAREGRTARAEAVRRLVQRVSPGPRLELFGRRLAPGWTVYGDQAVEPPDRA